MQNKLKTIAKNLKKAKKKRGSILLESVLGCLVVLFVFCAICDMVIMSNRNSTITDTCKELARTLSVQGGALDNKPAGFASNYYTISELSKLIHQNMIAMGFKEGEWTVSVKYTRVYDDKTNESKDEDAQQVIIGFDTDGNEYYTRTLMIDYLSNFTVTMEADYNWTFLRGFLNKKKSTLRVSLPGTSEFKYNYDYWPSET